MKDFAFRKKVEDNIFEFAETGFAISRQAYSVEVQEGDQLHLIVREGNDVVCEFVEDKGRKWSIPEESIRRKVNNRFHTVPDNDMAAVVKGLNRHSRSDVLLKRYADSISKLSAVCQSNWADLVFGKPTL